MSVVVFRYAFGNCQAHAKPLRTLHSSDSAKLPKQAFRNARAVIRHGHSNRVFLGSGHNEYLRRRTGSSSSLRIAHQIQKQQFQRHGFGRDTNRVGHVHDDGAHRLLSHAEVFQHRANDVRE